MFENIIAQDAIRQLSFDIAQKKMPPSVLFQGPRFSGKGTAALESARVFSCSTDGAPWKCDCQNCARHRVLAHPDLLVMGPRGFLPEINASKEAFLRENIKTTRALFLRSVRKLLLRLSPVIAEGDAKITKLNSTLESINNDIEEWSILAANSEGASGAYDNKEALEKIISAIIKNAEKIENEAVSSTIPVSHIRAASYWLHTAPQSNKKVLIIENAENTQDSARNSLLKTLEEPPLNTVIILTSAHPRMLLATILSRVRPYHFSKRHGENEADILRRVFREQAYIITENKYDKTSSVLLNYFENFYGVKKNAVEGTAAFFISVIAARAVRELQRQNKKLPEELITLGRHSAEIAERENYRPKDENGKPIIDVDTALRFLSEKLEGFKGREIFRRFMNEILKITQNALFYSQTGGITPISVNYAACFKKNIFELHTASEIYNQEQMLSLERFLTDNINGIVKYAAVY